MRLVFKVYKVHVRECKAESNTLCGLVERDELEGLEDWRIGGLEDFGVRWNYAMLYPFSTWRGLSILVMLLKVVEA